MWRAPFAAWVGAATFLAAAQTPSLLPRHWAFHGLVSGILAAIGYGIGLAVALLWRRLAPRELPERVARIATAVASLAAPIVVVVLTAYGVGWQRELHALVGLPVPGVWGYWVALLLAAAIAVALILVARLIRGTALAIGHQLDRLVPRRVAHTISGLFVAAVVIGTLDGVVLDGLFTAADESFRIADELVDNDHPAPRTPLRSGSSESLVPFDELGWQGRSFVSGRGTPEAIANGLAREPIRVYAGLQAADQAPDRAAVVVAELERTGAFERAVLCVMVATGTGWINPTAAAALEGLWDGDTALAAMQYSYLPSWLSFLVDAERGRESGAALFEAIHERWSELPEDARPQLLVFGESLGADGAEAAFSGIADIRNRTDGVLLVGPPSFSEHWSAFTQRRDPGTHAHLPIYDGGATVRFAARAEDLQRPQAPWYEPRVVYLQHASDPVVWWSPRLVLRRPDWLKEPRGADVLDAVRWFPVVTFWQLSADLLNDGRVPPGAGHNYGTLLVDAWVAIAAPDGWTSADTAELRARVAGGLPG